MKTRQYKQRTCVINKIIRQPSSDILQVLCPGRKNRIITVQSTRCDLLSPFFCVKFSKSPNYIPMCVIAHGTYIGSLRIEAHKPTQLPIDSVFHFGASTRNYILRERPQTGARPIIEELEKSSEDAEGGLLGLPETETELDVSSIEIKVEGNKYISTHITLKA
jgi:hypothetical protein